MGTFDDATVHGWLQDLIDAGMWVSLHYEDPALMGIGRGEISGGGYVRLTSGWSTPASRTTWNLAALAFVGLPAVTLTHFGIWDDDTGGDIKGYGALAQPKIIGAGQAYRILAGDLALSIA